MLYIQRTSQAILVSLVAMLMITGIAPVSIHAMDDNNPPAATGRGRLVVANLSSAHTSATPSLSLQQAHAPHSLELNSLAPSSVLGHHASRHNHAQSAIVNNSTTLISSSDHVRPSRQRPYKWQCRFPTCRRLCKSQDDLKTHERTHTGEKPFQCPYCGHSTAQNNDRTTHIKNMHKGMNAYFCANTNCHATFPTLEEKRDHQKQCPHRKQTSQNGNNTQLSQQAHHDQNREYKCGGCGTVWASQNDLTQHIAETHNKKPDKSTSSRAQTSTVAYVCTTPTQHATQPLTSHHITAITSAAHQFAARAAYDLMQQQRPPSEYPRDIPNTPLSPLPNYSFLNDDELDAMFDNNRPPETPNTPLDALPNQDDTMNQPYPVPQAQSLTTLFMPNSSPTLATTIPNPAQRTNITSNDARTSLLTTHTQPETQEVDFSSKQANDREMITAIALREAAEKRGKRVSYRPFVAQLSDNENSQNDLSEDDDDYYDNPTAKTKSTARHACPNGCKTTFKNKKNAARHANESCPKNPHRGNIKSSRYTPCPCPNGCGKTLSNKNNADTHAKKHCSLIQSPAGSSQQNNPQPQTASNSSAHAPTPALLLSPSTECVEAITVKHASTNSMNPTPKKTKKTYRLFDCHDCDSNSDGAYNGTYSNLIKHRKYKHPEKNLYPCQNTGCKESFSDREQAKSHEESLCQHKEHRAKRARKTPVTALALQHPVGPSTIHDISDMRSGDRKQAAIALHNTRIALQQSRQARHTTDNNDDNEERAHKTQCSYSEQTPQDRHDDSTSNNNKCIECDKTYENAKLLAVHMWETHTNRIDTCNICPMKHKKPRSLAPHMNKHTGRFRCNICGRCMTHKGALKTHKRIIHDDVGDISQRPRHMNTRTVDLQGGGGGGAGGNDGDDDMDDNE